MKIVRFVPKIHFVELFLNLDLIPYVVVSLSKKDSFDGGSYLFFIGMIVRDCLGIQDLPCRVNPNTTRIWGLYNI